MGAGYAVYRGPTTDCSVHAHGAFQIAVAVRDAVAMKDSSGHTRSASALVVRPMARHRLLATDELVTFFVEPQCVFADRLRECCSGDITAAPELAGLRATDIGQGGARSSTALDPRLLDALTMLRERTVPMPLLAASVGLSPQRLRALAREQVGMPLPRWRMWSRLRRAAEALQDGHPLAEAAVTAGFADQAHLTRLMRDMMGLTPSAVLPALRGQSLRAT